MTLVLAGDRQDKGLSRQDKGLNRQEKTDKTKVLTMGLTVRGVVSSHNMSVDLRPLSGSLQSMLTLSIEYYSTAGPDSIP